MKEFLDEHPLRARTVAFLVFAILLLLLAPSIFSLSSNQFTKFQTLAPTNYSENLSVYLTSSMSFWKVDLSGGNVSLSSVSIPQSVTAYSITLTHYTAWQSQYELFTKYGFNLLGQSEPYPDGALLVVNTTSSADAQQLTSSLGQRFALAFQQISSTSNSFTFFSPISFATEMHVYFWKLVPQSAGGFASMISENQFESNSFNYYQLSYASSVYSVAFGAMSPFSSTSFTLYGELNLLLSSYNYSKVAQSSTIGVHVLGGLINSSSVSWVNHPSNLSASIETSSAADNGTNVVPNINASLDFTFPSITAYRQITPSLTPAQSSNVSVTIYVQNNGGLAAQNVNVNDSWIYSQSNNFQLTVSHPYGETTLAPGNSMTVAYAFTVLASSGTVSVPATPVSYEFNVGNTTVTGQALLNPETIVIGGTNIPALEATETLATNPPQIGQESLVNVSVTNKGSGSAFNLQSGDLTKQNLAAGATWSFAINSSSNSLAQVRKAISYGVSWEDAGGQNHSTTTNTIDTLFSLSSPALPDVSISKNVGPLSSQSLNVTLSVSDISPSGASGISIHDVVPSGLTFVKSYNSSSISFSNGVVSANISSLTSQTTDSLIYELSVSNPNENYVFLPASVSTPWAGTSIVHYSSGYGLPIGVVATKTFSPTEGFVGTNVSVSVGIVNHGSLPIYQVSLNNTHESFLKILNSNSAFEPILTQGEQANATLNANLVGSPGVYNSSTAAATFMFAGANQTASSNIIKVDVYQLPSANLTYSATKVEERHDITVTITVSNPSNVTLSNISFTLGIPKGLNVQGNSNFTISSLAPRSNHTQSFVVSTNQPETYTFGSGNLTFFYQGHQLDGVPGTLTLNIGDDLTVRYAIPGIIALLVVIGTVIYVRRLAKK